MVVLVAFALLAILTSPNTWAQDTYNFYFQKAPGPVTVNQGAANPAASAVPPREGEQSPTPAAATTTVAHSTPAKNETAVYPWTFGLGMSRWKHYATPVQGMTLELGYRFYPWFGLHGDAAFASEPQENHYYSTEKRSLNIYSAYLRFVPLNVAHRLEWGLNAGVSNFESHGSSKNHIGTDLRLGLDPRLFLTAQFRYFGGGDKPSYRWDSRPFFPESTLKLGLELRI